MCHSFSDINRLLASGPDAPFVLSRLGSSASLGFSPHHPQLQRSCRFSASDTHGARDSHAFHRRVHDSGSPNAARYPWTISRAQGARRKHGSFADDLALWCLFICTKWKKPS
jgi:hypothetical protein